ncbi:MAG TPA: vWA domain-containing protein, partial [Undibacterium sp.]
LFLTKFNPVLDRMALIHFSEGAVVDDPIRPVLRGFDLASMNTHINALNFGGNTNSPEGFWNARDQLNSIALVNRSSLRVIVFFSDGAPNTFASVFTFKKPSDCTTAGSLLSGDASSGSLDGLYRYDQQDSTAAGKCNAGTNIGNKLTSTALPNWYNAHNPTNIVALQEFPVVVSTPRVVTSAPTYANVNRASRNLLEAMAAKARSEGIYVFSLGLGGQLTSPTGPDDEQGDVVLKCIANTADALPRCVTAGAGQPVGIYCHAVDQNGLKPCFDKLASAILRITK